ncbi:hypothetical protein Tco_1387305 [Tanacetum coccineum]
MDRRKWTATNQKQTRIMIKDIDQQLLHRRIMKSLEKFVGRRDYGTDYKLLQWTFLPQHLSDTKVFTMTMEILPEPTSNKLCDSILQARNPIKENLLKLNLPDHMSVLMDPKIHIKIDIELKSFKKDDYSSFQDKEKYEHVGLKVASSQEGKKLQDDNKRLDLIDDLSKAQGHIQVKL